MQAKLLEKYSYNPDTGEFTRKSGKSVGWLNTLGYRSIWLEGKTLLVHRCIWIMMTGEEPNQIDHINHIRDDNRWCNLRNVQARDQQLNMQIRRNNKTGVQGVRVLPSGRFCAYIMVNRVQIPLGTYDTIEEATAHRKAGEIKYGFHENHGQL